MAAYNLTVPSCYIHEVRSPIKDTLVASMGLRVLNAQGGLHMDHPPQSKPLGDHRHHNTVAIDLSYSDVDVPDPTPESPDGGAIYWTLVLTNTASSGAVTDAEKIVLGLLKALADKEIVIDDEHPIESIIRAIGLIGLEAVLDLLTPGRCDGIVGALSLNLTARQLADMTPDPKKMPCPGTESPIGCGGNSNYDLYYSVARGKRPDTGQLLSYGDAGTPGNVSDPVVVGFGGWSDFNFLFAGTNLSGEHRLYAVNQDGQLLSYGDAGTPGNVSDPVVVGFGGWLDFKFLFAGTNLSGEPRIYAVVA
jgi:hypothetical protein